MPRPAGSSSATSIPPGATPIPRLTLTLAGIARARLVVFTVAGADKQRGLPGASAEARTSPPPRVRAERVVWLCDPAAVGSQSSGLG